MGSRHINEVLIELAERALHAREAGEDFRVPYDEYILLRRATPEQWERAAAAASFNTNIPLTGETIKVVVADELRT